MEKVIVKITKNRKSTFYLANPETIEHLKKYIKDRKASGELNIKRLIKIFSMKEMENINVNL